MFKWQSNREFCFQISLAKLVGDIIKNEDISGDTDDERMLFKFQERAVLDSLRFGTKSYMNIYRRFIEIYLQAVNAKIEYESELRRIGEVVLEYGEDGSLDFHD
ncbi:hypothetical protein COU57_05135 [Candidatus Pacearchaeota archaeon CG10_big_fil_rev_8_21_14_0_10_32_14]|nr:MAG: hypothetical protein COU57_05135 [Candidatus Pacearchaeota archaeon CG10_big_fil_rev_8_21_14_0_10_32_14]